MSEDSTSTGTSATTATTATNFDTAEVVKPLHDLTEEEVALWLRNIGLARFAPVFAEQEATGDVLGDLSDDDLRELGLQVIHRKKFEKARKAALEKGADITRRAGNSYVKKITIEASPDVTGVSGIGVSNISSAASSMQSRNVERKLQMAESLFSQWGVTSVQKYVGSGGFSDVFLVQDRKGESVIGKWIPCRDQKELSTSEREANGLMQLRHKNIVKIYALHVSLQPLGLACMMEYLPGGDLEDLIFPKSQNRNAPAPPPLAEPFVLAILYDVACALQYLHDDNIFHRDIKPANILLDESHERAVLADFGLMKDVHDGGGMGMNSRAAPMTIAGTVYYFSPEQHEQAAHYDAKVDMFALGLVLLDLLLRKREGGLPGTLVLTNEGKAIERWQAMAEHRGYSEFCCSLLRSMLRVKSSDRMSSAELVAALSERVSQRRGHARRLSAGSVTSASDSITEEQLTSQVLATRVIGQNTRFDAAPYLVKRESSAMSAEASTPTRTDSVKSSEKSKDVTHVAEPNPLLDSLSGSGMEGILGSLSKVNEEGSGEEKEEEEEEEAGEVAPALLDSLSAEPGEFSLPPLPASEEPVMKKKEEETPSDEPRYSVETREYLEEKNKRIPAALRESELSPFKAGGSSENLNANTYMTAKEKVEVEDKKHEKEGASVKTASATTTAAPPAYTPPGPTIAQLPPPSWGSSGSMLPQKSSPSSQAPSSYSQEGNTYLPYGGGNGFAYSSAPSNPYSYAPTDEEETSPVKSTPPTSTYTPAPARSAAPTSTSNASSTTGTGGGTASGSANGSGGYVSSTVHTSSASSDVPAPVAAENTSSAVPPPHTSSASSVSKQGPPSMQSVQLTSVSKAGGGDARLRSFSQTRGVDVKFFRDSSHLLSEFKQIAEGIAEYQTKMTKKFKKTLFLIDKVMFYKCSDKDRNKVSYAVPLRRARISKAVNDARELIVRTSERELKLKTESEAKCDSWIQGIDSSRKKGFELPIFPVEIVQGLSMNSDVTIALGICLDGIHLIQMGFRKHVLKTFPMGTVREWGFVPKASILWLRVLLPQAITLQFQTDEGKDMVRILQDIATENAKRLHQELVKSSAVEL
uniref:Uncharacterized protein n=1 Tax=Palpitomonas bilix TaxID=652834 RepID=A0A7S3D1R6_9EUKA|mmetsp:Transcript_18579/g.46818  ORF Transcript_18579/g.46818 Transcript_18579/m.46818 type:complete len:1095 (+) Transcript_18579:171-3455(+)